MADRCALCPGVNDCLPPDGDMEAEVVFVGEAPGKEEQREKRVFVGKTGEEYTGHYLPLAGLKRQEVLTVNAIQCLPVTAGGKLSPSRGKDLELLECCTQHHLYGLLERVQPRVIVPMGSFACRALDPDIDLELHHGFPRETAWGTVFPMYHPALGIHEPKKMLYLRTDFDRLRKYLRGRLEIPHDEFPQPDYREVEGPAEIALLDPGMPLAADTESDRYGQPFCLTYSQRPGTGRLIRAVDTASLAALRRRLADWHSPILFHHWLHDWPITESLGLDIPHRRVVDTLSRAFHLGNIPQGLKALALRELGMAMQDFVDVVRPHSTVHVLDYYRAVLEYPWEKPPVQQRLDPATGELKDYKPQSMNTKMKRFFTDFRKNPALDVFARWANWEEDHTSIEAVMGPWPGLDIRHVPFDQSLFYACRDVDALIRLWPVIEHMRRRVRRFPQERWRW